MTTLALLSARMERKPAKTLVVPPSSFADTYSQKPQDPVCLGLRLISSKDALVARSEAARVAWEMHPNRDDEEGRVEAYNDALVQWVVAHGTCDPNNVREAHPVWGETPEATISLALTPDGAMFIFRAIDELARASCPTEPEATDEEVDVLAGVWERLGRLPPHRQARIRRTLHALVEELESLPAPVPLAG